MKPAWIRLFVVVLIFPGIAAMASGANAQASDVPGVRGSLYESPTYGWTTTFDPSIWKVETAISDEGVDGLTISAWEEGELVAAMVFVSFRSLPELAPDCLRLASGALEVTITTLTANASLSPILSGSADEPLRIVAANTKDGEQIYGEYPSGSDHWIAAYIVNEALVAEVDCWPARSVHALVSSVALTPVDIYKRDIQGGRAGGIVWSENEIRNGFSEPEDRRTGQARAGLGAPRVGVLEFGRGCAHRFMHRAIDGEYDIPVDASEARYPRRTAKPGEAFVMHAAWVGNPDSIPSYIDLGRLIARFPAEAADKSDQAYMPIDFAWIAGAAPDTGATLVLTPGQMALYVVWYAIPASAVQQTGMASPHFAVRYQPLIGGQANTGVTSATGETIGFSCTSLTTVEALSSDDRGGGARPRPILGD